MSVTSNRTLKWSGRNRWLTVSILVGLIILYLLISIRHLDTVPPVYEDEPWIASVAWKLSVNGVLGSDLFSGFYGMEQHYYGFMPLNQLLSAPLLRYIGLGLFQIRVVTVLYGLVTLLLTYALGVRLFGVSVGLLAVAFLLLVRTTSSTTYYITGIPFLDFVRIYRYDPGVAVFGLAGLNIYLFARKKRQPILYLLTGFLVGLAGLMHLYGAFWLVPIVLLALIERADSKDILAVILGFSVPWVMYGIFVATNIPDWRGQVQFHQSRFQLLDPSWYWHNLTSEYKRYSLELLPISRTSLLRFGSWFMLLIVPFSIAGLGWRAYSQKDPSALMLFVPGTLLPLLYALLLSIKFRNYLSALLPILALIAAWGTVSLWRAVSTRIFLRGVLVLVLLAIITEGIFRITALEEAASRAVSYEAYIANVRDHLPKNGRILGLHRYWIGLHDLDYISWLVPLYRARDIYQPIPVEAALDQIDPQVVLIDPAMRRYLSNPPPGDSIPTQIQVWMDLKGFQPVATIEDVTYGMMEIFQPTP